MIDLFLQVSGIVFWVVVAIIGFGFANKAIWCEPPDPNRVHPDFRDKEDK